ncbi:unnamed protein product [Ixodes pacificus]
MAASSVEGPLSKWTNVMKGWQYRWFVLDDNAGLLSYYTSKENMARGARRGCVRLQGAVIGIDDEDDSTFTIRVDRKIFHFQARDAEERERWVRALEDTILRHTLQRQPNARLWDQTGIVAPTQQNFDTKLTEADSYLQLLIEQIRDLEFNIEKVTDLREKQQLSGIGNNANALLETVKHTIVLLQIAKVSLEEWQDGGRSRYLMRSLFFIVLRTTLAPRNASVSFAVPPVSYSSSDDEDFFDAREERDTLPTQTWVLSCLLYSAARGDVPCQMRDPMPVCRILWRFRSWVGHFSQPRATFGKHSQSPIRRTCACSTREARLLGAPEEMISSRLLHAPLTQFRQESGSVGYGAIGSIGTLTLLAARLDSPCVPVVALSRLLRALACRDGVTATFAALWCSIVDHQDPRDRMVEVVRWYLSAFHAGRKTSVAKKPYNPILGEIFRCYWRIGDKPGVPVPDGPVPWATSNDLCFIAEQVSHHPPVSAFYAEHVAKGIACCGYIWTKSKFLGMSIGVHNVGQGCIMFLRHDEEYTVTFPSGYGRSIFTVPWIELGGTVDINCQKTGYSCTIQFHTKPIIGGRRHQLTAEIFPPNDRRPFLTVTGEWNGVMTVKKPGGDLAVFVDTTSLPITKKVVKPIEKQEPYESRRMWKEVTLALKNKDVNMATEGKSLLEEKQRSEARERKENNVTWQNRVFHEVGEHWVYNNSLQKRLGKKS